MQNKNVKKLALFCYGALALFWLVRGIVFFAYDRAHPTLALPVEEAALHQMEPLPGGRYQITGADPQLVFEGLDVHLRSIDVQADFDLSPGELDLYYVRSGRGGFSAAKRVLAIPGENSTYHYNLLPGRYTALRIDTGWVPGNIVAVYGITLNPQRPLSHYLLPTPRNLAVFALLPALACCVIYTIINGIGFFIRQRRQPQQKMPE